MPRTRRTTTTASRTRAAPNETTAAGLATPALASRVLRMEYAIGRGEQGVLTFEPYKSLLLPLWRFRTAAIARESSEQLGRAFDHYVAAGDFVGADMARKFLQMGMTRARRYANHRGGRKYDPASGQELARSEAHEGREEKVRAADVFRAVWERCKADGEYKTLKERWVDEKKEWQKDKGRASEPGKDQ